MSSEETSAEAPKEKRSGKEFMKENWEKLKYNITQIPMGIEEPENKLHMTTSKLFALMGALYAIFGGRDLFLKYPSLGTKALPIIFGLISVAIGLFIFVTLNIIDFGVKIKKKMPYEWFILMGAGIILVILNLIAGTRLLGGTFGFVQALQYIKGGVLMMIGGFILLLKGYGEKRKLDNIQIISLIGIVIGVYEAIYVGLSGLKIDPDTLVVTTGNNVWAWITAVIMILILLLLALSAGLIPFKLPKGLQMSWWLVLSIGMAMQYFGFELSGTIINMVFLLILIAM
jgi:hypothetical protein